MGYWLFKFKQPGGFEAMREETYGFTQLASHVRVSAQPGDELVIYNIEGKHVAAVVRVIGPVFEREEQTEHAERWRYAVPTEPLLIAPRGPKRPVAGRNFRRIDEAEFRELERVVKVNSR
ncbi:EVE domain-containing protein [Solirubrobacter pauli]|uniref:EVE domain-containing protein n=1 Tax=Solirubrobacter pauli TaxID=166793 RepID=A0A660LAF0_9ACTN|nr:EVE domain-containing protein [Solirubrobacter pauli]RKQ90853.1 EVE domain-containing protein [Solirubrobacter pauli]